MVNGKSGSGRVSVAVRAALAAAAIALLAGCKKDCSEAVRTGDFEFLQGNYVNAVRQYEKALRADADCRMIDGRLEEARRKAASSH